MSEGSLLKPLLILLALVGVWYGGYHHGSTTTATEKDLEIAKLATRYDKAMISAQQAVNLAKDAVTTAEHKAQFDMAALDQKYREELKSEKDKSDRTIADLRTGAIRLSYKSSHASVPACSGNDRPANLNATSGTDGSSTTELPPAIAGRLYSIAADADALAINYGRLQEIVKGYLKVCGPAENTPVQEPVAALH